MTNSFAFKMQTHKITKATRINTYMYIFIHIKINKKIKINLIHHLIYFLNQIFIISGFIQVYDSYKKNLKRNI